jgi:hypothetical protein
MAKKQDPYRATARMVLEPWLVEAALTRLARGLSPADQRTIVKATRTPRKVKWPEWWSAVIYSKLFFAILTKRRLKRGVFKGVVDLQAAINRFVADHNQQPKPFVWASDPDKIIAAANRGHQVLDSIH